MLLARSGIDYLLTKADAKRSLSYVRVAARLRLAYAFRAKFIVEEMIRSHCRTMPYPLKQWFEQAGEQHDHNHYLDWLGGKEVTCN